MYIFVRRLVENASTKFALSNTNDRVLNRLKITKSILRSLLIWEGVRSTRGTLTANLMSLVQIRIINKIIKLIYEDSVKSWKINKPLSHIYTILMLSKKWVDLSWFLPKYFIHNLIYPSQSTVILQSTLEIVHLVYGLPASNHFQVWLQNFFWNTVFIKLHRKILTVCAMGLGICPTISSTVWKLLNIKSMMAATEK